MTRLSIALFLGAALVAAAASPGARDPASPAGPAAEQAASRASTGSPTPPVVIPVLELQGVINPPLARYLARELRAQAAAGAPLVVVQLDTPGGLERSMREMVEAILASPVPVVVWVGPAGARASSAGLFLTLSAGVAAMAPGTNLGAAHPVVLGGRGDGDAGPSLDKATSDAAAFARSLAELRGRNGDFAERAVSESASLSASEALREGVIELVAPDLSGLAEQLAGWTLPAAGGVVQPRLEGATFVRIPLRWPERVVHTLADPNLAFLLLTLGLVGVLGELFAPGAIFPGLLGTISLLLAAVALGNLPIGWAGLLLIALGVGLLVAEATTAGFGLLGAGAIVSFVLGSLLLYRPSGAGAAVAAGVQVSPWLVGLTALLLAALVAGVVRALLRTRHAAVQAGAQALLGRVGTAASAIAPQGTVVLDGEQWTARSAGGPIPPGEPVQIVDVHGVTLTVTALRGGGPSGRRPEGSHA